MRCIIALAIAAASAVVTVGRRRHRRGRAVGSSPIPLARTANRYVTLLLTALILLLPVYRTTLMTIRHQQPTTNLLARE